MPIGKNSINRVAQGLDEAAMPMTAEVAVTTEVTSVEATATAPAIPEKDDTVPTAIEKTIVKSTAKKPAAKKPAAKKPTAKKAAPKAPAAEVTEAKEEAKEEAKAPELIGQAVAAPAPKKRGRKPGSKNKKKPAAVAAPKRRVGRPARKPAAATAFAIGEELPVYLL